MTDGPGAPDNQEISPIKAPIVENKEAIEVSLAENSAGKKPRSLNEDLWHHLVEGVSLKDSPHVVEQVDQPEVSKTVNEISDFYDVPQKAREDGLKSEIFIIKDESMDEFFLRDIRLDRYREMTELKTKEEIAEFERSMIRQAQDNMGILEESHGRVVILLRESATQKDRIHELIHSMGVLGERKTLKNVNNINEAVTEILALHFQYPDLDVFDLGTKIYTGEIKNVSYPGLVGEMLQLMEYSRLNPDNSFTFKDLARYFFNTDAPIEGNTRAEAMIKEMILKINPKFKDEAVKLLNNDLKD